MKMLNRNLTPTDISVIAVILTLTFLALAGWWSGNEIFWILLVIIVFGLVRLGLGDLIGKAAQRRNSGYVGWVAFGVLVGPLPVFIVYLIFVSWRDKVQGSESKASKAVAHSEPLSRISFDTQVAFNVDEEQHGIIKAARTDDAPESTGENNHIIEARRQRMEELNAHPEHNTREELAGKYGEVWNTQELDRDFDVIELVAPYAMVRRKSDGTHGKLEFCNMPRFYFNWETE